MSNTKLQIKINKIGQLFNIDEIVASKCDTNTIATYYRKNILPYYLFHNRNGFVHMGLSKNNNYQRSDVLEQVRIIESYITRIKAKNVLELATGKGANLECLAHNFSDVSFTGIDLPGGQISETEDVVANLPNVEIVEGDYHDLSYINKETFDVVFVIEALCHSTDKRKVAGQVHRILKPDGLFIVFDGYRSDDSKYIDETSKLAMELTQKSMAVERFEKYSEVVAQIQQAGFDVEKEEDFTKNIFPTLYRFEKLANCLFFNVWIGKIITKVVSEEFAKNAIAGYLMPDLVSLGLAKYYLSVCTRK